MKASKQNGNVLFIILIAVALFAALNYAVTGMLRGDSNASTISEEKAGLLSNEILTYAQQIRSAVKRLKISNDCSDEDISFEDTANTGYVHSPIASDDCKVFLISAGGINYKAPSADYGSSAEWVFSGAHSITEMGTSSPDLLMVLSNINSAICLDINDKMSVTLTSNDAPTDTGGSFAKFTDTYSTATTIGDEDSNLEGKAAACFKDTDDNSYHFYQVLIAR